MPAVQDEEAETEPTPDAKTGPKQDPRDAEIARLSAELEGLPVAVDVSASPEDGTDNEDRIELVRTGLIRVWIGGKRHRLRRPFFGEFKTIRMALQDMSDEISDVADEAFRVGRVITDAAKGVDDSQVAPDEWVARRKKDRQMMNDANRTMSDVVEQARLDWWEKTWSMLSLDGRPEDWPAWIADPNIANALVSHWRLSPLGRG